MAPEMQVAPMAPIDSNSCNFLILRMSLFLVNCVDLVNLVNLLNLVKLAKLVKLDLTVAEWRLSANFNIQYQKARPA